MRIKYILFLSLIAAAIYFAKSFLSGEEAIAQQSGMPPPAVEVHVAQREARTIWKKFPARLEAVEFVEIKPRVSGAIDKIYFKDGAFVKKGERLFLIDPREFEADVANATAELNAARSRTDFAKAELARVSELVEQKFVSDSRYDSLENNYKVALADVKAAGAHLKQARLDLEFANIKAPVSGKVSRAEVTIGNIVEAGPNAPVLTTIVSRKIFAEFDVDEASYLEFLRSSKNSGDAPVQLSLANGDIYNGKFHSFDNQLDASSGTIRARAIFANENSQLVPGIFADVRLGSASEKNVILIPQKSISTDQDKKFVYAVDENGAAKYVQVKIGESVDGMRIVESGLTGGEKIIVNNLQKIRPGAAVQIKSQIKTQASE